MGPGGGPRSRDVWEARSTRTVPTDPTRTKGRGLGPGPVSGLSVTTSSGHSGRFNT